MLAGVYPLQVLLMTVSGLVNRHQANVIAYFVEENRVLKEQMKGRAIRLNDDQRRRFAAKAKLLASVSPEVRTPAMQTGLVTRKRMLFSTKSTTFHSTPLGTMPPSAFQPLGIRI